MAALLISGCSGLKRPSKDITVQIHTGTTGLAMSFLKNAPPSDIQATGENQRTPFQVGISLENKGAYDIKDGHLLLSVERNYMEIMGWQLNDNERFTQVGASGEKVSFKLKGRSDINPTGEIDSIFANVDALPFEKQSITRSASIRATACYGYQTLASASVCIDTDAYNLNPIDKSCTAKDISLSGGQGGPISVDKIDVSVLPNNEEGEEKSASPQFVVHISNKGDGLVFNKDKVSDACSSANLKTEDINTVTLDDISFSGYSLKGGYFECSPIQIRLRGQDDKFVCKVKKGIINTKTGAYSTTLEVVLEYGYSQTISKDLAMSRII
ncbi:hypothetical protein COV19_00545 [Candidatus Woesearchaeota archaeon CG10_big_fil_rev_8_21_14_0_10_44_13]|nr:MAG: hypothetical protein COV19_00545 [Candidatus Woesearchaeota archaeon CG10_big_fil_rev_8_21_14_0_10_44_13]